MRYRLSYTNDIDSWPPSARSVLLNGTKNGRQQLDANKILARSNRPEFSYGPQIEYALQNNTQIRANLS